ncbi:MAG: alpha/beta hydrolase [Pseudomonadota bacterium]
MPTAYLFLHGGPAMSSIAERLWYGESLPVDWWDQPRAAASSPRPYAALVGSARNKLRTTADARGGKIALLAHSFGAQIALELAAAEASYIASLTLLAPAHDMRYVWLTLAQLLQIAAPIPTLQQAAARFARDTSDEAAMSALWYALAAVPTLFDCYWGAASGKQMACHRNALADYPDAFDLAAFAAILADYLRQDTLHAKAAPVSTTLPVSIWYGNEDRIVDNMAGRHYWSARFPHATIGTLNCGHFIQFEQSLANLLG